MSGFQNTGRGGRGRGRGRDNYDGGRGRGRGDGGRGRGDRNNDGGGRDGRGGGRFDGGRGRGVGGGGGRGGNLHMGTSNSVLALFKSKRGMSDTDILAVVKPTTADRESRHSLALQQPFMPDHNEWRMSPRIGVSIGSEQNDQFTVRANHFAIDSSNIPKRLYHYHINIYLTGKDGENISPDLAIELDSRVTLFLLGKLRDKRKQEWVGNSPLGYGYDGKNILVTTAMLPFNDRNEKNQFCYSEIIAMLNSDGSESAGRRFRVMMTLVDSIDMPNDWRGNVSTKVIQLLEIAMLSQARWEEAKAEPQHILQASAVYSTKTTGSHIFKLNDLYVLLQGFRASLRSTKAGLMLISDMATGCFLATGRMDEMMWRATGLKRFEDFCDQCSRSVLSDEQLAMIKKVVKDAKIKLTHINHSRKVRDLGPPANSQESAFEFEGHGLVTVAEYFNLMEGMNKPGYSKLQFPQLPTINVGSKKRPVLVPPELILVVAGQSATKSVNADPQLSREMIKRSAVVPEDRMRHVMSEKSVLCGMKNDSSAQAFGLSNVSLEPMRVPAIILPPGEPQYKQGSVDPQLNGSWNMDKKYQFYSSPPNAQARGYMYGVVIAAYGPPRGYSPELVIQFRDSIEKDSRQMGTPLFTTKQCNLIQCKPYPDTLKNNMKFLKDQGVQVVIVILGEEGLYGTIKRVTDSLTLTSQCIKLKNLIKAPRAFNQNLMLKINTKLGGTNHALKSRLPKQEQSAATGFQKPPASIAWIFDKPCMLVGIDVSHPEPGSKSPSMAAVVGSVNGSASQYVAHLSSQTSRTEMVSALTDAMTRLFISFRSRNGGSMPESVVIYRDGVSDGQFETVLTEELPQIQDAIAQQGYMESSVKVSVVICRKGHATRLTGEDRSRGGNGMGTLINPCPGLVVDSTSGDRSITSATFNEFYLNSHAAIQGTCKPCKYALIYDEIGFKLSELELLTYWTTYLYARCNRSVSYATPAYYAHWLSKRGKELNHAGCDGAELANISANWAEIPQSMFFI